MERQLVPGGFYKHFKNKLYQVKCVAYHSETKEKMVVYQAMYGEYAVYVRPYDTVSYTHLTLPTNSLV